MLALFTPYLIGIFSALPFIVVWRWPATSVYAIIYLLVVALVFLWFIWEPRRLTRAIWPWILLLLFWLNALIFFLFLEQDFFRLLLILMVGSISWWYVLSWLKDHWQIVEISHGPSLPLALALVWIIFFFSGVNSVSWLVFLDISWWLLFLVQIMVIVLSLLSIGWIAGWTIFKHWPYLVVAFLILTQSYVIFSWWPVSFYLVGWLEATVFLVFFLFTRYDTGVGLTKRVLVRNLLWIIILALILIATTRWF
ncbi:MAG: hypothetical protein V1712_02550 [Patescibacteria group bacterium]